MMGLLDCRSSFNVASWWLCSAPTLELVLAPIHTAHLPLGIGTYPLTPCPTIHLSSLPDPVAGACPCP
jgi:hypothetical protein